MIYTDNVQVDAQGRLTKCPVCGNTEFSDYADYCKICGMSRKNLCMPDEESREYPHENPANARFCERCGAITVFFHHKLLLPWEQVPANAKKEAPPQMVGEEDLPF